MSTVEFLNGIFCIEYIDQKRKYFVKIECLFIVKSFLISKFSAVIIYFIIYRPGKKYDDLKKNLHLFLIGAQ